MKNKKLLISAGVCLLLEIFGIFFSGYALLIRFFRGFSVFCVVGTFVFDGVGKRRGAIACAAFGLVETLLLYQWVSLRSSLVVFAIRDVLLMVFVLSKNRSRNTWMIIGIVLTILPICNHDGAFGIVLGRIFGIDGKGISEIPFGLMYLFGFMDRSQAEYRGNKKPNQLEKKTTTSYLEQYKQEHGMK